MQALEKTIGEDDLFGGLDPDRHAVERVRARDDAGTGEDDPLVVVQRPVRPRAVGDVHAVHGDAERDEDGRAVDLLVDGGAVHFEVVGAVGKPEVDVAVRVGVDVRDAVVREPGDRDGPSGVGVRDGHVDAPHRFAVRVLRGRLHLGLVGEDGAAVEDDAAGDSVGADDADTTPPEMRTVPVEYEMP